MWRWESGVGMVCATRMEINSTSSGSNERIWCLNMFEQCWISKSGVYCSFYRYVAWYYQAASSEFYLGVNGVLIGSVALGPTKTGTSPSVLHDYSSPTDCRSLTRQSQTHFPNLPRFGDVNATFFMDHGWPHPDGRALLLINNSLSLL